MQAPEPLSYEFRFRGECLEPREREIVIGALNRYGECRSELAAQNNLHMFSWDQVQRALIRSSHDCVGDSRDDVEDVIFAVRQERANYVN